jgi:CRP-like cAMP-binding protein
MSTMHSILEQMTPEAREALLSRSDHATFPAGTRIFREHQRAEKFWVIESGTVDLDTRVPGHESAVIETLGCGELLGGSRATASREVRTPEFDAAAVRRLCHEDSAVGRSVSTAVAAVIADRLDSTRTRLLDLFAPHGSGTPLAYAR